MKPVPFPQANVTYAEHQPEYLPLPACRELAVPFIPVTSCWGMTWRERLRVFFTGRVFVQMLTFGQPLQPLRVTAEFERYEP